MKAPCKALLANKSQHCWKLHVVSVCTPCCMLLCVVGRLEPFKLLALFKRMQHCWPAPPNIVVSCCVCLHVALSMLRHNESYRGSDSFTLNQKDILIFLKNLLSTKRTVSVDTILYHKLFRSFLSFFLSSALLSLI